MELNDFEQAFVKDIMENSDGSEKRIGDFVIKHDFGANVYYVGSGGDVIIPEEIGNASLMHAFANARGIRSLQYPSCIKRFWSEESKPGHFGSTKTLERLVFSEGLERIEGSGCFAECKNLKDVVLPDSLEYLGSSAFKNTPWYKQSVEVVEGCHYLGRFLISSDKEIVHANVREGTVMICDYAFKSRKSLISVSFPDTLKTIGEQAFNGCVELKEVRLPKSVQMVEGSCFSGCASLSYFEALNPDGIISSNVFGSKLSAQIYYPEYVYIPRPIVGEGIEKMILGYCYLTSRERFSPEFQAVNDAIVKKNKTKLLNFVMESGNVVALQNIAPIALTKNNIIDVIEASKKFNNTEITAFLMDWKEKNLGKADIEKQAKRELNKNPMSATELKKIWGTKKMPDGTLGITSYKGTDTEISIPESIGKSKVTVICKDAFSASTYWFGGKTPTEEQLEARRRIHSVVIPEGVVRIERDAFSYCTGLKDVIIPESTIRIEPHAFYESGIYNDPNRWENNVLYIGHHLIEAKRDELSGAYVIKEGTTCISENAFSECKGLTEISIPDSVKSIGHRAFRGCNALSDEEGFIIVNHILYGYCGPDSELMIPDGVELIDDGAFSYSKKLTGITIPEGVTGIGEDVFSGCENLKNVSISGSVKSIGDSAFYKCTSLIDIEIPEGVVTINDKVFDRSGLRTAVLPRSVTHIGEYAFPPSVAVHVPAGSYAEEYTKKTYFRSVTLE